VTINSLPALRIRNGFSLLAAVALILLAAVQPLRAFIDEALSIAYEAAVPFVEKGFEVREDHWTGEIPSGEPKLVRHQLFRGNEYWFWLGTSFDDCEVTVEIFDAEGDSVGLETFSEGKTGGVRVLPSQTGTYYLRVTVTSQSGQPSLDWALVYGYR